MHHEKCSGKIELVELPRIQTVSFVCLKCGKVWKITDDLDDIWDGKKTRSKEPKKKSMFYEFARFHPNPFLNFLLNYRLVNLVNLIKSSSNENFVGIDIGCQTGYLSKYLAENFNGTVIGVDLSRIDLSRAKLFAKLRGKSKADVDFIMAEIGHLPFKAESLDLIVCASVLEHIADIHMAITQMDNVLKLNGSLLAGYPIEHDIFISMIKLISPSWMKIRDPNILGKETFEKSPDTHKQSYKTIRIVLEKRFKPVQRTKSFFTILPDFLSWYECQSLEKLRK